MGGRRLTADRIMVAIGASLVGFFYLYFCKRVYIYIHRELGADGGPGGEGNRASKKLAGVMQFGKCVFLGGKGEGRAKAGFGLTMMNELILLSFLSSRTTTTHIFFLHI